MLTEAPPDDWIAAHRAVWARKPALQEVYGAWFRRLWDECGGARPVVELGCGPGFFKERFPDLVATDVVPNPHADRVADGGALPFGDAEVGALVMLDVFHHLPDPEGFLREAVRVLKPGGRLALIEPWPGLAGRFLYKYVHHEYCDTGVDPRAPWGSGVKDAMDGNAALPYLFFRRGGRLDSLRLPLRRRRVEPFAAVAWLLSGGFQPLTLLPRSCVAVADALDRALSLLPALTATRCLIVVERTAEAA